MIVYTGATASATVPVAIEAPRPPPVPTKTTRAEQLKQRHRQQRVARYEQVMALHRRGLSMRAIARQLGMHRRMVRRFVQAGSFPERASRVSSSRVDPYEPYLRQRWDQGCHNAVKLTLELTRQGFRGSYHTVRRRMAQWRSPNRRSGRTRDGPGPPKRIQPPSPRQVAWWMVQPVTDLKPYPKPILEALYERCHALRRAADLAQTFTQMVRQRQVDLLDAWLEQTREDDAVDELRGFAKGLLADEAAVRAALSLEWSNGQVEGQINRLKLIKRQMYGRAKFDLLRQRFLHAG